MTVDDLHQAALEAHRKADSLRRWIEHREVDDRRVLARMRRDLEAADRLAHKAYAAYRRALGAPTPSGRRTPGSA